MSTHFGVKHPERGLQRLAAIPFQYPGGEWHLKEVIDHTDTPGGSVWIARVDGVSLDDFALAALFAQVAHARQQPFVLLLPYLPAARSDRSEPVGADPVGVDVYGSFANAMNPQQIIGIDPHSPVAERYYHKLTALDPTPLVVRALNETGARYEAVIAPDHGAIGRAKAVAEALEIPLLTADKHRDFETGKIRAITIDGTKDHSSFLVVDDICDGGGTFMGLAQALGKNLRTGPRLGLWVTHGIFSGNAGGLRTFYDQIHTTDSHPGHNSLDVKATVIPCETYMLQNVKENFA